MRHDLGLHGLAEWRRGQMMGEPLSGLLPGDRFAEGATDGAELAVLTGTQAEEYWLEEGALGFGKVGRNYPRKLVELGA